MATNDPSGRITIEYRPIDSLKPHRSNARTHSNHQIRQIAKSIDEFDFINPVLVDSDGSIVAGHGRVAAARLLGISEIPTIRLESLSPDQIRAYILADNKLAEKAGWDKSTLAIELQYLLTLDDFDITLTGFEVPEIDLLLSEASQETEEDRPLDLPAATEVRTRPGDLWVATQFTTHCSTSACGSKTTAVWVHSIARAMN